MLAGEYSINAKLLYGFLLNRTMLSQKSGWESENGNVSYNIVSVEGAAAAAQFHKSGSFEPFYGIQPLLQ